MRFLKKYKFLLIFLLVGVTGAILYIGAHAQSLSVDINLDWVDGSSCYGTINGHASDNPIYYPAVKGDTLSLHLVNASSTYTITTNVEQSGQTTATVTLPPNNSTTVPVPVNSEITVFDDGNVCASGHGGSGVYFIEVASGDMSCTILNNQVWQINFNFTGIANDTSLYRGTTFVDAFNIPKAGQQDFPVAFSAQSSAATYYLYYGSNSSSRLLGQATCPAKSTAAASASSGTSKTTAPKTSTPSTATPAPATGTTPPPNTPTKTQTPASGTNITTHSVKTRKSLQSNPWLYVGLLLLVVFGIGAWKFKLSKQKNGKLNLKSLLKRK